MANHEDREAFIPYRRTDIIELCIEDGKLSPQQEQKFRDFCTILSAYYHFKLHHDLEVFKDNYAPFNPDADTKSRVKYTKSEQFNMETEVSSRFQAILERANYRPMSKSTLKDAFDENSLIDLKTDVDFDDFDQMVCFTRGDSKKTIQVKKLLKKVDLEIDTYERVALLIKCKPRQYFEAKKVDIEKLNFTPGKMYVYLYKNIPKYDLEFIFPNVKVSMTLKDRLILGVPAVGAAIPILLKVIPELLLIFGVIAFLVFGPSFAQDLGLIPSEEDVNNMTRILVGVLSMGIALGGFGFRQYTNYKNKQLKFQKDVTETLFFKNLSTNVGVFQSLIDAAEEEECKEIILVYYHLLTSNTPLRQEQLDDRIEGWMEKKFNTKIDFDISGPLKNLAEISSKLIKDGADEATAPEVPLLSYDEDGSCHVLPLEDAKQVIDYIWDNAFMYA
ncbi:MAG: TMEM143 family protein [Cyanobacteriota bacterium]|nr:TMEM143 family protein [Cyanobacteriota bacterium]